ncbi:UPF0692 protein CG33108-like [Ctenocephalides felis]|uniref:UPF0692 protein CG33108-like n=1 Tax=Ctenocephalides felis TaxID=7515 RepID=UPI000E6E1B03|nr:UPF0692 protein CG33108-like [Ctenocephalides felis]
MLFTCELANLPSLHRAASTIKAMSISPPIAPPLPPQFDAPLITLQDFENKDLSTNACLWASQFPELQWTCNIHKISLDRPPIKCTYRKFQPQKQIGPTCGLVALSILLGNKVTAEELLTQARGKGYSINGEMFSAKYLLDLLKENLDRCEFGEGCKVWLHEGSIETVDVMQFLLEGGAMLVPYDAWYNHSPCQANGNKAHWALVCGIVIPQGQMARVLAWHGKSQRLAIWELADLSLSNSNLNEFSPNRERDGKEYVLPDGGINGPLGICGRCIMIEGFRNGAVKICS